MQLESSLGEETLDGPLSQFRTPSMETTFVSEIPSACEMGEIIVIAPGEGKKPVSVLNDKFCKELGHPHLLPTGQYDYKGWYTTLKKFASDNDYIFFAFYFFGFKITGIVYYSCSPLKILVNHAKHMHFLPIF